MCTNVQYSSHYMCEYARISNWFNEASVQKVQNQRTKLYNVNKKKWQKKNNEFGNIFRYFCHVSNCFTKCFTLFHIVWKKSTQTHGNNNNKSQKASQILHLPYLHETNFSIIMLLISGKIILNCISTRQNCRRYKHRLDIWKFNTFYNIQYTPNLIAPTHTPYTQISSKLSL